MEPQPLDRIELENGLTLEILDASRKVAADRWQVKLIARMRIEVSHRWFGQGLKPPAPLPQMRDKLGDVQYYENQAERNFVDRQQKAAVLQSMRDSVLNKIEYYRHADFAARFLIKAYNTYLAAGS